MENNKSRVNSEVIEREFQWLYSLIESRIQSLVKGGEIDYPEPPTLEKSCFYKEFIHRNNLSPEERIIVAMALGLELRPEMFNIFYSPIKDSNQTFMEFGGIHSPDYKGFIPTEKTGLFVLSGDDLHGQIINRDIFKKSGSLFLKKILKPISGFEHLPEDSYPLKLTATALSEILTGEDIDHEYSADFPAERLTSEMEWEDMVLNKKTSYLLSEMLVWPDYGKLLSEDSNLTKRIQPGYRALFYGPPGTGKTLAAALYGKKIGKPVYRVDLSQVVSKYIGETEKNLNRIFSVADKKDWVLFFDEADVLFGKRTSIKGSNDRYANQETAYLLQKVESCENIVILATNLMGNMDEAFRRRFHAIVEFLLPDEGERYQLWRDIIPEGLELEDVIDLKEISRDFNISGGYIVNAVRYASVMALSRSVNHIKLDDLIDGIRKELFKQGKRIDRGYLDKQSAPVLFI